MRRIELKFNIKVAVLIISSSIPVDPRQEQWFYLGAAGFMEQADTKWIFPMHFWEDYTIIPKLIEHPSSEGWRDRIVEIHKEGEEFIR